ncbi:MAG TPA: hypothetical protein VIR57_04215 [Chloroflexota bacterium]
MAKVMSSGRPLPAANREQPPELGMQPAEAAVPPAAAGADWECIKTLAPVRLASALEPFS